MVYRSVLHNVEILPVGSFSTFWMDGRNPTLFVDVVAEG
jgi:hypothetical protein